MGMVHAGMAKHGIAWFARYQTSGKGQRSRLWESERDANIMMSVVAATNGFRLLKAYTFNANVAVACCTFLMKISGEEFKIKWPNDLMWRDRKAGGILIENIIRGNDWLWSVVGMGININQKHFENLDIAISLYKITGIHYDVIDLAQQLQTWLMDALETNDPDIISIYNSMLYKKGEQVSFKKDSIVFKGVVERVDEYGLLHLLDQAAPLSFGEVQWVLR